MVEVILIIIYSEAWKNLVPTLLLGDPFPPDDLTWPVIIQHSMLRTSAHAFPSYRGDYRSSHPYSLLSMLHGKLFFMASLAEGARGSTLRWSNSISP